MRQSSRRNNVVFDRDILTCIFEELSPRSLARCAAVCSEWRAVATSHLMKQALRKQGELWRIALADSAPPHEKEFHKKLETLHEADDKIALKLEHCNRLKLFDARVVSWQAHSGRVNCCEWSMDTLATGSSDHTVKIWSMESMRCMEMYTSQDRVVGLEFDESKVIAASGTEVYIWKRRNIVPVRKIGVHNQRLHSMHFIDPQVAAGCGDGTIRIFDVYSGQQSLLLRHDTTVTCLGGCSIKNILTSGSHSGIRIWDLYSGCCVVNYETLSGILCLKVLADGWNLIAGTMRGELVCLDLRTKSRRISVANSAINSVHCPDYLDSGMILTGGEDGKLRLVKDDRVSRAEVYPTETSYSSPVLSARLGFTRFVSCHADGTIKKWTWDRPMKNNKKVIPKGLLERAFRL